MNRHSLNYRRTDTILLSVLVAVAFVVLTIPVWRWLWQEWMGNDYYSHGVLVPFVAAFLGLQRIRNDKQFTWRPQVTKLSGLIALTVGLIIFLYFIYEKAYYLAGFTSIGILACLVWLLGGGVALRKLAFPLAYLMFMVPLPFIERSTLPLAMFTGVCSGGLVQFLGMDVNIVGNAVSLPNANLVIGAQCSGINSLITLLSLTTLIAYLFEGPLWGRLTLIVLAVPLAMASNILRVSSLIAVARAYGVETAFRYYHDYSGLLFFILMLLLIFPLTKVLHCRTLRLEVI